MEIWKDISGFEGLYQVSDCGQVKLWTWRDKIRRTKQDRFKILNR